MYRTTSQCATRRVVSGTQLRVGFPPSEHYVASGGSPSIQAIPCKSKTSPTSNEDAQPLAQPEKRTLARPCRLIPQLRIANARLMNLPHELLRHAINIEPL